jgi:hypothetical protein
VQRELRLDVAVERDEVVGDDIGEDLQPSSTEMRSPTSRMIVEMGTSSASATDARISLDASFWPRSTSLRYPRATLARPAT